MNKKLLTIIFLVIIFSIAAINNSGSVKGVEDGNLVVYFLDVGQGDATLIRTPDGNDILIDGGRDNTVVTKLGQYLPFYDRDIEVMILTHPDSDHVTGLIEVLRRYRVEKIMMTGVSHNSSVYKKYLAEISDYTIVEIIDSPRVIDLGGGVQFDIIYPLESFEGRSVDNINNTSITGRLIYGDTSIMMTGDLEIEEELLDLGINLKSDIYKSGHHGAKNANDKEFVLSVDPEVATISVGEDNSFGHPHYRTIKNLEKTGAEIFRTDIQGDLIFYSNGQEFFQVDFKELF